MATQRKPITLATRSAPGRYGADGAARLINCFPEKIGPEGTVDTAIYCMDGLTRCAEMAADGGVRAIIELSSTECLADVGRQLYRVDTEGNATALGGTPSDGMLTMASNRVGQVGICCDGQSWYYANGVLRDLTDSDLRPSNSVTEIDGYLVFTQSDGGWQYSGIDDVEFDVLDVATAESNRDGLVRGYRRGRELLLFGTRSLEAWANTGGTDFVFSRSTAIDVGCAAPQSIATVDQTVAFIAHDGTVRLLNGYDAQVISSKEVERLIADEPDPSTIRGFSWQTRGTTFYGISGATWTRVFVAGYGWTDRESRGRARWRVGTAALWGNQPVYGDIDDGILYRGSRDVADEDGDEIIMTHIPPPLNPFPGRAILSAVHASFVTGVGVNSTLTQDADPHVMFSVSRDGGKNWGVERRLPLGKQGQPFQRATARRLGLIPPQGMMMRWSISARVARGLMEASADMEMLGS